MKDETCELHVQVIPKASRTEIAGWDGKILKVRLNAVPEKGKANKELIEFLAKWLKLPKTSIQLHRGDTSRLKTFHLPLPPKNLIEAIEGQLS